MPVEKHRFDMHAATHTPPRTGPGSLRDRFGVVAGGAAVLIAIVALFLSAARYQPVTPGAPPADAPAARFLPSSLGSLDRAWTLTGAEALREVRGLHLGTFRMTEAEVGGYGQDATLWVATPSHPEAADRYVTRMAEAIAETDTPFAPPSPDADTLGVWWTEGTGQQHVFFAADGAIWWLAADADDAQDALSALLHEVRP
jgi:hypothetical protein